ncbi:head completion/stabilization protein [Methylobacter sp. S3L5C]|uniref:head completion/stabilization protein n=1 Tax=Methylobacter sp. S3L5C TaxID=2839024 RepID=UPI001FABED8D|nr:head completion/stabilization protein [Methylobacter sp. S3L5C]UOA08602.1 head completion/stabilization protein [Methylobacter sp. S3L5C]
MSLTGKPSLTASAPVINDVFWPDLLVDELMTNYRIPSEYADGVIMTGLTLAVMNVNIRLTTIKAVLVKDGYENLAAYTLTSTELINGSPVLLELYKHAVYARAKGQLLMQFVTINRRPQAENAAKEGLPTEQYWLDESQTAIAEFFRRFLPEETVYNKANVMAILL